MRPISRRWSSLIGLTCPDAHICGKSQNFWLTALQDSQGEGEVSSKKWEGANTSIYQHHNIQNKKKEKNKYLK